MPQFIPVLLSAAATAAGATALTAAFVALGASLVVSSYTNSRAKKKARDQFNAAQVDRLVNVASTTAPRELVLGRVRKGGHVFFRGSVGRYREKFVMLIALADHEIDGVEGIYLNDVPVTLDSDGYVTTEPYMLTRRVSAVVEGGVIPENAIPGTVWMGGAEYGANLVSYQYEERDPKARIRIFTGSPNQAAAADVVADFPSLWTAEHRARGVAYLHCEFWYDETAFPSGLPNVTAVVRGARCFDPRTGTTAWTQNPAVMMRHVLTHPAFGKRTSLSAEETAQIVAAANACDTPHDYGAGAVPLYRAATVVPYGSSARDALDDLAQAMAGQWAYAAGAFFLRAGVYTAPVLALTEADLAVVVSDASGSTSQQGISISTHRARNDKFNVVTPTIWDAGQDYKQTALTPLRAPALITRDGVELVQDVAMPGVFHAAQALHIAGVAMRDARDPLTISLPLKLRAYPLQLFDVVTLTLPRYGWAAKQFVVLGRQWSVDGMISMTLKEASAAITQPDAAFAAQGSAQNTALPRPWEIQAPTVTSISSGTADLLVQSDGTILPRVRVQWAALSDPSVGSVEVQWQLLGTGAATWRSESVPRGETQAFLVGAVEGSVLAIRVRTRNSLAVSDWTLQQYHTVVGKTEPPPPFDTFLVLAQPDGTRQFNFGYNPGNKPPDWLGAEIRYQAGTHAAPVWANMTRLQDDATHYTASPIEVNAPLAGEWTFACRSVDTSGNLSTARIDAITLSARRTGNVYDEFLEEFEAWPGTRSGFALLSNNTLEAADAATWATLPATWAGWTRWNTTPATNPSYTSPGRDMGTVLAGQVDAKVDADGAATLEISTSADGTAWGPWVSAASAFTARWVRLRVTVAATLEQPVPAVRSLGWNVSVDLKREYINDVVTSALTGAYRIGVGDIRIPVQNTYAVIKRVGVTIQDSRAGAWSWQRIDNALTPGPRLQFKLNGALTDPAFVDFDIEGI
jgi:hypothetical protein